MNGPPLRASNTSWIPIAHDGECHGAPRDDGSWCNHSAHWQQTLPKREKWRANYLPSPHYYNLEQACFVLRKVFDALTTDHFGIYLVGSSRKRRDCRDVDVRLIMGDAGYDRIFHDPDAGYRNAFWSFLCTTTSAWLSQQSGLPIDFQIQRMTQANRDHPGAGNRAALGIFLDYPGERPSETKETA